MRDACWSIGIALGDMRISFSRHRAAVCFTPGVESLEGEERGGEGEGGGREGGRKGGREGRKEGQREGREGGEGVREEKLVTTG